MHKITHEIWFSHHSIVLYPNVKSRILKVRNSNTWNIYSQLFSQNLKRKSHLEKEKRKFITIYWSVIYHLSDCYLISNSVFHLKKEWKMKMPTRTKRVTRNLFLPCAIYKALRIKEGRVYKSEHNLKIEMHFKILFWLREIQILIFDFSEFFNFAK